MRISLLLFGAYAFDPNRLECFYMSKNGAGSLVPCFGAVSACASVRFQRSLPSPLKPKADDKSIVGLGSVDVLDNRQLNRGFENPSFGDELKAGRKEDFMRPIRDEPTVELRHRTGQHGD